MDGRRDTRETHGLRDTEGGRDVRGHVGKGNKEIEAVREERGRGK